MTRSEYEEFIKEEELKKQEEEDRIERASRYGKPRLMMDLETGNITRFSGWSERYGVYTKEEDVDKHDFLKSKKDVR